MRYDRIMVLGGVPGQHAGMNKRIAAAVLWFLAGWYVGGFIVLYLGVSDLIGPILGVSAAVLFGGDPLGIIWTRGGTVTSLDVVPPESPPEYWADAA